MEKSAKNKCSTAFINRVIYWSAVDFLNCFKLLLALAFVLFITGGNLGAQTFQTDSVCTGVITVTATGVPSGDGVWEVLEGSGVFNPVDRPTTEISGIHEEYNLYMFTGANGNTFTYEVYYQEVYNFTLSGPSAYCEGDPGVTLTLGGSQEGVEYILYRNGTPFYSVQGTGNPIDFIGLESGSYFIEGEATYDTNCPSMFTNEVNVTETPYPQVFDLYTTNNEYCEGSGAELILSGSQTGISYRYQLHRIGTGEVGSARTGTGSEIVWTGIEEGSYFVTAVNTDGGCYVDMNNTVQVSELPSPETFSLNPSSASYCAGTSGVTLALSGSETNTFYQLKRNGTDEGMAIEGDGGPVEWSDLPNGTYTVTAVYPNGCTSEMNNSSTVTRIALPQVFDLTASASNYCEGTPGVTLNLSGSQTGVTYILLKDGITIGNRSGTGDPLSWSVTEGEYMVEAVTDDPEACSRIMNGNPEIEMIPSPPASAGPDVSICEGESTGLTGSGGVSYHWAPGDGLNETTVSNPVASPSTTTTYTLTVTDIYGCTAFDDVTVTVNILPNAIAGTDKVICRGEEVQLNATGGTSYQWSPETGLSNPLINNPVASPLSTTEYTVAVTNEEGCMSTDKVTVSVNPLPSVNAGGDIAICEGESAALTASGTADHYLWNTGEEGESISVTPSSTETYSVTGTFTDTGCTATDQIEVAVNPLPEVFSVTGGGEYCEGSGGLEVGLSGSSTDVNYMLYRNSNLVTSENGTGSPFSYGFFDNPGTYTCGATDMNTLCSSTMAGEAVLEEKKFPGAAQSITGNKTVCPGSSVIYSVPEILRADSYEWTLPPNASIISGDGTREIILFFPSNAQSGTLSVRGINDCGEGVSSSASITVSPLPSPAGPVTGETDLCEETMNILFSVDPVENASSYLWEVPQGAEIYSGQGSRQIIADFPAGSQSGTITVTPVNVCGTGTPGELEITVTPLPHLGLNPVPGNIDCSDNTVLLSAYSNDDPQWWWTAHNGGIIDGSQDESSVEAVSAGTYRVTATLNGCSSSGELSVIKDDAAPENVSITLPDPSVITCNNSEISLEASTTSTFPVSYSWSASAGGTILSGQNTSSPVIGSGGYYTVTVKNLETSCTTVKSVVIDEDTAPPDISVVNPAEEKISCINSTVQLSGSSSTSGVSYYWTGPGNISDPQSQNPFVDASGTYTLTVTGPNGCSASDNVQVQTDYEEPHVWVDSNPGTIDCGSETVTLYGTSTTEGASLHWSGPGIVSGGSGETPVVDQPGDYTLTVTHPVSGCTSWATVTVIEDTTTPTVGFPVSPNDISCANPTVDIQSETSAASASYQWTTTGGVILSGADQATVTVASGGTYTLTVTDNSNSCSAQNSIDVGENLTPPGVSVETPELITCNDPAIELSASSPTSPVSVQWNTTDGNIHSGSTTFTPTVNSPGTYTIFVTDPSNGCISEESVDVAEDRDAPYITINTDPDPLTCGNTEVQLNGYAPGATLLWTGPEGASITGETTSTPWVDTPGLYTLEATGDNGCISARDVEVSLEDELPEDVEVLDFDHLSCSNTTTVLRGSSSTAGSIFSWESTGGGNILTNPDNEEITVDSPGTYILTVFHPVTLCPESVEVTVEMKSDTPVITFPPEMPAKITCSNPSTTLESYVDPADAILLWEGPGTIEDNHTTTPTVTVAGEYTLIATHPETGCTSSKTIEVESDLEEPEIFFDDPGMVTCDNQLVEIVATTTASPVTPQWSTGNGSISGSTGNMSVTVSGGGIYTLTLTDNNNGCESAESIEVFEDTTSPEVYADNSPPDITCKSPQSELYGTSPTPGVTYLWDGPGNIEDGTTEMPKVDLPGDYTLTVTRTGNGCSAQTTVTVGENLTSPEIPQVVTPEELSCNTEWVELKVSPYIEGVDYLWSTTGSGTIQNATGDIAWVNEPGEYTVEVTDRINGCTSFNTVNVLMNTDVSDVEITGGPFELNCGTESLTLSGVSPEGIDPVWTTEGGHIVEGRYSFEATVNAPGEYTLTVHHPVSGCPSSATVTVGHTEDVPLIDVDSYPGMLTCGNTTVTLYGSPADPSHSFAWSTADGNIVEDETTHTPVVDMAGTYVITVTNPQTGCTNQASILVEEDLEPAEVFVSTPDKITCNNQEVQLNATSTVSNVSYYWTTDGSGTIRSGDENKPNPVVLSPGIYTLTVTRDSNQCTSVKEVEVFENTVPPHISVDKSPDQLTCDRHEVVLSGSSLTEGALFQWTSESGSPIANPTSKHPRVSEPDRYFLTVTDPDNGCESVDDVIVTENTETPHIWITPDPEMVTCENSYVTLEGSSNTENVGYSWTGPGNIDNPSNNVVNVDSGGRYYLTVTANATGCSATLYTDVEEDRDAPPIPPAEDGYACEGGEPETLTAAGENIRWYTNSNLHPEYLVHEGSNYTPPVTQPGTYYYYVTQTGSNGCESEYKQVAYTVRNLPAQTVTTDAEICEGAANTQLHATGSSVRWYDEPYGEVLSAGDYFTPDASVSSPGSYVYYATQTDSHGCESQPAEATFTIRPEPSAPVVSPTEAEICKGEASPVFIAQGENIRWYGSPTAVTPLYSGNEYIPSATSTGSHTYHVSQTSSYGCESERSTATLTIHDLPQKFDITGGGTFCEGDEGVEIGLDGSTDGVEYTLWLDGSTVTGSETGTGGAISFGLKETPGSYTVTSVNANGCETGMNGSVTVAMTLLPGKPETVTGLSTVCQGSIDILFETAPVENASSYVWTLPDGAYISSGNGTRSVHVDFSPTAQSGPLKVRAANSCGQGPVSDDHYITVEKLPGEAGSIISSPGNENVCRGDTGVIYEVDEIPDATGYEWILPPGAEIVQGEGTRTIRVNFANDAATGDQTIIVRGVNDCGEGTFSPPFTVVVDAPPSVNTGADMNICGSEITLNGSEIPAGATANWETVQGYASFSATDIHNPELSEVAMGENSFVYSISQNACTATDTVKVTNNKLLVDAGEDRIICSEEINLSGSPLPEGTTGLWSVAEGSASFSEANRPGTEAYNFGENDNKLYWTVTKNGCESTDSVIITNHRPDPVYAGQDQISCNGEAWMNAEAPSAGQGEWAVITGGGLFDDRNDPGTRVHNLDPGNNKLAWTVTNHSCSLSDTVMVNNLEAIYSAGHDQFLCESRTTLEADPLPGGFSGEWSVYRGSALFMDNSSHNTQVSGLARGENQLVWTVSNETCTYRDTLLLVNNMPTPAYAGPDQEITVNEVQLEANDPDIGTGKWSIISGGGTFDDDELNTAYVTDLVPGTNTFRWTISHENCESTSDVAIENGSIESVYAGEDQILCEDETNLNAAEPSFGFGVWTVQQGSASFEDNTRGDTPVTNLATGTNILRWSVSAGATEYYDTVIIVNNKPTAANAGPDRAICSDSFTMAGNMPVIGTGIWTLEGGSADIEDIELYNTGVENLAKGNNIFRWTITNESCVLSDAVIISNDLPTEADAGPDQESCSGTAELYPNTPSIGTGEWSVISGSGQFEDNFVYGLANGENHLRYTIRNNQCTSSDDLVVTSNKPTEANAGFDVNVCSDHVQLSASTPNTGIGETGEWTVINGSGTFDDITSAGAFVTDLAPGKNVFRWTIYNEGCVSYDEIEVSYDFIEADAGWDITTCEPEVMLNANNPGDGNGQWSVVGGSGSARFENPNNPNTRVSSLDKGTNILRWTITNNLCVSFDEINVVNNSPSDAFAGSNSSVCSDETTLAARNPLVGTGTWSVINGSGNFENENSPGSAVNNMSPGSNTYRWTVSHEGCTSTDEVVINNDQPIDTHAGNDQVLCEDSAQLTANLPQLGEGVWSIIKGSGVIDDPYSNETTISGLAPDENILRWTVTEGQCSEQSEVRIVNNKPTTAQSGSDRTICEDNAVLDGNMPLQGTGTWSVISGSGDFDDEEYHTARVTNLSRGKNVLRWTITKENCTSTDDVSIQNDMPTVPDAGSDIAICGDSAELNATNPVYGTGEWIIMSGSGQFEDKNRYNTSVTLLGQGTNVLRWRITNNNCSLSDEIAITNNMTDVYAGPDQVVYENTAQLSGNEPPRGTASWSLYAGNGEIEDPYSPDTWVSGLSEGTNTFLWSVDIDGCVSSDEVQISYFRMPSASFTVSSDNGCPPLDVRFTKTSADSYPFRWEFGDGNISLEENPVHTYGESGSYISKLVVTGPDGEEIKSERIITVHQLPEAIFHLTPTEIYIPDDELVCYNYSTNASSYLWDFGDGSTSAEFSPAHIYEREGEYKVSLKVWSAENCVDSTTYAETINVTRKTRMRFPSAFKPNLHGPGDGRYNPNDLNNEVFYPIILNGEIEDYKMEIYNRWGVLIFESTDLEIGWDGYHKGKLCSEDVYIYRVSGVYNNGEKFNETGDFLLMRQ